MEILYEYSFGVRLTTNMTWGRYICGVGGSLQRRNTRECSILSHAKLANI